MRNPLVDITTMVGIESLFHDGPRDPWARRLAGQFADLFAYSDSIRLVVPVPDSTLSPLSNFPTSAQRLADFDASAIIPVAFLTTDAPRLREEHLVGVFDQFCWWARANRTRLAQWSRLHQSDWIQEGHGRRIQRRLLFSLDHLRDEREPSALAHEMDLDEHDLLYALDVVLRYPVYGALAGEGNFFLNHPIRNAFPLPTAQYSPGPLPNICVSFAKSVTETAEGLSLEDYVRLLIDLRSVVRENPLDSLPPGSVDADTVRQIAQKVRLTPYLKNVAKRLAVAGAFAGGLGAIPVLGPGAALASAVISVSAAIWDGRLPRGVATARWLAWAFRWTLETEADPPEP